MVGLLRLACALALDLSNIVKFEARKSQYIYIVKFEVFSFTVVNGTIFRSEFAWRGGMRGGMIKKARKRAT
jgi:hypothetical protein